MLAILSSLRSDIMNGISSSVTRIGLLMFDEKSASLGTFDNNAGYTVKPLGAITVAAAS